LATLLPHASYIVPGFFQALASLWPHFLHISVSNILAGSSQALATLSPHKKDTSSEGETYSGQETAWKRNGLKKKRSEKETAWKRNGLKKKRPEKETVLKRNGLKKQTV
jgi:hypothetical protein